MDKIKLNCEHYSGEYCIEIPEGVSLIDAFDAFALIQKLILLKFKGEKCQTIIDHSDS